MGESNLKLLEGDSPSIGPAGADRCGPIVATNPAVAATDWRDFDAVAYRDAGGLLADEMSTYAGLLESLLPHEGWFVVIKGNQMIGLHTTLDEALEASAERFGEEPALIKRITRSDPIQTVGTLAD